MNLCRGGLQGEVGGMGDAGALTNVEEDPSLEGDGGGEQSLGCVMSCTAPWGKPALVMIGKRAAGGTQPGVWAGPANQARSASSSVLNDLNAQPR